MSKNLKKKALAFGSMLSLAVSGITAFPATAATDNTPIKLNPGDGVNFGAVLGDAFEIDADVPLILDELLDDTDDEWFALELVGTGAFALNNYDDFEGYVFAYDAKGDYVDGGYIDTEDGNEFWDDEGGETDSVDTEGFVLDFAAAGATRFVLVADYWWDIENIEIVPVTAASAASWTALDASEWDYYNYESNDASTPWLYAAIDYDESYSVLDPFEISNMVKGFGDKDKSIKVRWWVEQGVDDFPPDAYSTVDLGYASKQETITWYDPKGIVVTPRIERFMSDDDGLFLNDAGSSLGFTLQFNKPINLDQLDASRWNMQLKTDTATVDEDVLDSDTTDIVRPYGTDDEDESDRLYAEWDYELSAATSYRVTATYDAEDARTFTSTAFRVASTTVDDVTGLSWSSTDTKNVELDANDPATTLINESLYTYEAGVRSGTKSVTWTAQLRQNPTETGGAADTGNVVLKQAGLPIGAIVWTDFYEPGTEDEVYLDDGQTVTVNGVVMDRDAQATVVVGNTNADGQFSITVTHSSAKADEGYFVEFFYLESDDSFGFDAAEFEQDAEINVVYEDTEVADIATDTEVVASSKVNLTYEVTDQFGEPVSSYDGDALSVKLTSTNTDDVELYKAVAADGTATFTFDNYLKSPDTDVLSAEVGIGLSSALFETLELTSDVTYLYATYNVSSIILDETLSTYVAYGDFVNAKTGGPEDDAVELAGTVAGADNGGLPGAPVVIKGAGLQFHNGTTYSIGEATVIADVDGNFSVDVWTHSVNAAGQSITVTSGNVTKTVKLTSALPSGLDGENLSFGWTLPAQIVKNTTYAVTLKLTDKWGNPLNTSAGTPRAVTVYSSGSLEVNGVDEVSRNFGADGTAVVYIRSVKDIAGPGSLEADLSTDADYATVDEDGEAITSTLGDITAITTNATGTAWDESTWSPNLEKDLQVLDAPSGKVNVGSFNGKLVVYASGLQGSTISWKVGGVWGKAVATSNYSVFDRPTPRRGVTVTVDIYVNGVKQLTKSVVTR